MRAFQLMWGLSSCQALLSLASYLTMTCTQVGEDPFTQMKKDKAGRVKAGEKLQLANVKHSLKTAGKGSVPPTLKLAASLPEHGRGKPTKRKELKQDVSI